MKVAEHAASYATTRAKSLIFQPSRATQVGFHLVCGSDSVAYAVGQVSAVVTKHLYIVWHIVSSFREFCWGCMLLTTFVRGLAFVFL